MELEMGQTMSHPKDEPLIGAAGNGLIEGGGQGQGQGPGQGKGQDDGFDPSHELDFNDLLERVGSFGTFQMRLCAFLVIPSAAFCAQIYFAQYFILFVIPDHWCALPLPPLLPDPLPLPALSLANATPAEAMESLKETWIPFEMIGETKSFSKCLIYEQPNVLGSPSNLVPNLTSVLCSNGWHFDYKSLYPTIATENNWVCLEDRLPYNVQTIFYIGSSLGCILFGYISDRFGRKPSIIASYTVACVAGLLTSCTTDYYSFAFLRLLVGATLLAFSEDPYVLSLEYIGIERRTMSIICWVSGYIISSAICPWIAYGLKDWKALCLVTSAPLLVFIVGAKYIPESSSWLLSKGRKKEALLMLQQVAKINGKVFPESLKELISSEAVKLVSQSTQPVKGRRESMVIRKARSIGALHIFISPRLRTRTLLLGFVWFTTLCCYHTNIQNTSNLGTDIYTSFTYGALMEFPSVLFVWFGLDRMGRRWPMVISTGVAGVSGITSVIVNSDDYLYLALILRIFLATQYNVIIQYSAEVYPTVLRGRAIAFLRLMGTFGLYISPSIAYLAGETPYLPFVIMGFMLLLVSLASLFLPETLNKSLPHTMEEGENFGNDDKLFHFPCLQKAD